MHQKNFKYTSTKVINSAPLSVMKKNKYTFLLQCFEVMPDAERGKVVIAN